MKAAVKITNLYKQYPKNIVALDNVSFSIDEGDFFALLGQNGAGKSTLIGIMVTLVNKTRGKVEVFEADLDKQPDVLKRYIGLVPQEFNFNIFEPVGQILMNNAGYFGIPKALAKKRSEKWLKQLKLWEKRHTPAGKLSGGMKRRLMIARSMMHQPRLLILDEPTSGVDVEIRHDIWAFLKEVNQQGTTVILTTHYLEEAEKLCENVGILHKGQLIEHVSKPELLQKLKKQTFLLELEHPLDDALKDLKLGLEKVNCHIVDKNLLEIEVEKGESMNVIFEALSKQSISVAFIRSKSNRLERLFMEAVQNK